MIVTCHVHVYFGDWSTFKINNNFAFCNITGSKPSATSCMLFCITDKEHTSELLNIQYSPHFILRQSYNFKKGNLRRNLSVANNTLSSQHAYKW